MTPKLKGFLLMMSITAAAAVVFWLLQNHLGHVLALAPFLLFFSCPLMHLFMHHGHSQKSGSSTSDNSGTPNQDTRRSG
jgi:hypothetical protein